MESDFVSRKTMKNTKKQLNISCINQMVAPQKFSGRFITQSFPALSVNIIGSELTYYQIQDVLSNDE